MYALGSSPPPPDLDAFVSNPNSAPDTPGPLATNNGDLVALSAPAVVPVHSRKRKRGQAASTLAASPAPSDPGSTAGNGVDLLSSRTDLYARPVLSIARGPTFIPVSEDSEWFKTDMAAVNRLGYRYMPAGINPQGFITPCRTIESNPTSFRISWEDRSPFLKVTKDGLGLGGAKGFRSARCNAPMREGKWYLEVKIELGGGDRLGDASESAKGDGSHVRLGWGRREAPLNGPAGLDGYSYGYRDKTGEKVTISRPRPYGKSFKSGDVVGMYISLPPLRQPNKKDPNDPAHIHRERIPIDLKGQEVFEILEYPASKEMSALMETSIKPINSASVPSSNAKKPTNGSKLPDRNNAPANTSPKKAPATVPSRPLPILPGSRIAFFVNGECQGTAFQDIYDFLPLPQTDNQRKSKGRRAREGVKEHRENPFDDGTLGYYPMISVFNDAAVKINPGPDFEFPPPPDIDAALDGKPQSQSASGSASLFKTEPESTPFDEVKMDVDEANPDISTATPHNRTWRPAIERYPEFMKEQWALDALEEEEAKVEFEKQKAKEAIAASKGSSRGRKGEPKKPTAVKVSGSRKKKPTAAQAALEATSKAGTPALEDAVTAAATKSGEAAPRARKKAKKAEAQAALGVLSGSHPQQHTEASTPRSATETPSGTPPPPSISSTAAAAAAAHLHLHHHTVNRQELSNRPSPSPLRQSTAYRELDVDAEMNARDSLPVLIGPASHALPPRPRAPPSSKDIYHSGNASGSGSNSRQMDVDDDIRDAHPPILIGPASHAMPRPRAPPGSKEGRQRAAAAAAAAAQVSVWPANPTTSVSPPLHHPLSGRGGVGGGAGAGGGGAGGLMSLASLAVSASALPTSSASASSKPMSTSASSNPGLLHAPLPSVPHQQHRPGSYSRGHAGGPHSRGGTASVGASGGGGGSVYNDNDLIDEDLEDEFLAAAGGTPRSDAYDDRPEDYEEEEEEDGGGASEYETVSRRRVGGAEEEEEEEEEDMASVPGEDLGGDDGATTDGDSAMYVYDRRRGRDIGEETDDGRGTNWDDVASYGGSKGGTRSNSPP